MTTRGARRPVSYSELQCDLISALVISRSLIAGSWLTSNPLVSRAVRYNTAKADEAHSSRSLAIEKPEKSRTQSLYVSSFGRIFRLGFISLSLHADVKFLQPPGNRSSACSVRRLCMAPRKLACRICTKPRRLQNGP